MHVFSQASRGHCARFFYGPPFTPHGRDSATLWGNIATSASVTQVDALCVGGNGPPSSDGSLGSRRRGRSSQDIRPGCSLAGRIRDACLGGVCVAGGEVVGVHGLYRGHYAFFRARTRIATLDKDRPARGF